MSNIKDAISIELVRLLNGTWLYSEDNPVVRVISWKEETTSSGYCDTCYSESTDVYISYVREDGETGTYRYYGDTGELIRELTDN